MSKIVVDEELEGFRLDKALTKLYEGKSRSYALKCIEEGKVKINGSGVKPSYTLKCGDEISYELLEEQVLNLDAKDLNIPIIYEMLMWPL